MAIKTLIAALLIASILINTDLNNYLLGVMVGIGFGYLIKG